MLVGPKPAYVRHASIERVGNRTSSLRRLNRSSFTANRQPAVLQQRGARIVPVPDAEYVHDVVGQVTASEEQILDERPAVARRAAPHADVRARRERGGARGWALRPSGIRAAAS